jgi:hypothetical protein
MMQPVREPRREGAFSSQVRQFFRELRRRKVPQTSVLYLLLAWFLLQAGEILLPGFGFDDSAAVYLLAGLIAGFPVAALMAWYFQITPRGIVRTRPFVERRVLENIPPINDRRRDGGLIRGLSTTEEMPHWRILAESGPLRELEFAIEGPVVIGRALECEITLVAPHLSRRHARLSVEEGALWIEDLGSSNGTMVNGQPVTDRRRLQHRDQIAFFDIVFTVIEEASRIELRKQASQDTTMSLPPS